MMIDKKSFLDLCAKRREVDCSRRHGRKDVVEGTYRTRKCNHSELSHKIIARLDSRPSAQKNEVSRRKSVIAVVS
jgi:hypothetical protein